MGEWITRIFIDGLLGTIVFLIFFRFFWNALNVVWKPKYKIGQIVRFKYKDENVTIVRVYADDILYRIRKDGAYLESSRNGLR